MSRSDAGGRASSEWNVFREGFEIAVLPRASLRVRYFAVVIHAEDFRASVFCLGLSAQSAEFESKPWHWVVVERTGARGDLLLRRWARGAASREAAYRGARKKLREFTGRGGQ